MDVIVETFGTWTGFVYYPNGTKSYSSEKERLNVTYEVDEKDLPHLFFEVREVSKEDPFRIYVEPLTYRTSKSGNGGRR